MLELYTHPMSPCAQKVRIVLAEKGLTWEGHHVSLPDKENLEPGYLRLNPLGVVPTLVDDGKPIIESSIICEYLDDKYPRPPLRPADPYKVARMRFWMKHIDNKLHPSCGALQWPLVMADRLRQKSREEQDAIIDQIPEKPRRERQRRLLRQGLDAPDIADAVKVYATTIKDMNAELVEHRWLCGDDFSLGDAAMAPYFQTLHQFGWTGMYERYPRVADWYAACRARESYRTAVAGDFDDATLSDLCNRGKPAWDKIQSLLPV